MGGYIGATAVGLTTTAADVQGDITSTDTTPELILKNTSEEDTEGGREGKITFKGEQSGGEETTLAQIESAHDGTSDDEKGDLIFKTNDGNDGAAPTERLRLDSAGDMLLSSPDPSFTITNTTQEDTDGGRESTIVFKGEQSGGELSTLAEIEASHDGTSDDEKGDLIFRTNDGSDGVSPTEAMRITSDQRLGIGTNDPSAPLNVSATYASDTTEQVRFQDNTGSKLDFFGNADGDKGIQAYADDGSTFYNLNLQPLGGNVGINNSSPNTKLDVIGSSTNGSGIVDTLRLRNTGTSANDGARIQFTAGTSTSGAGIGSGGQALNSADLRFYSGGNTERIRITNGGATLINQSTSPFSTKLGSLSSSGIFAGSFANTAGSAGYGLAISSASGEAIYFYHGGTPSSGVVGSVITSSSSTAFNTTSDYRLKENVTDVTDGITRVKQLAPKRFNFITDADRTVDGFLAHEAATVVPEAVTGEKDALQVWVEGEALPEGVSVGDNKLDDDGNTIIKPQGIDQSKLVPLLTAALQEAIAKIETLETKVAALEGA